MRKQVGDMKMMHFNSIKKIAETMGLRVSSHALDEGRGLLHGRAFLYGRTAFDTLGHVEWSFGKLGLGFRLGADDDEGSQLVGHIIVPGARIYWGAKTSKTIVAAVRKRAIAGKWDGVNIIRLSAHDGYLGWEFMHSTHSWESTTPRWRNGSIEPLAVLFGGKEPVHKVLEERDVVIPLPEGTYNWTITLRESTWKRPRSPFKQVIRNFDAKCKEGEHIPEPGKGENSYDCGPDATFSIYSPCEGGIEDAVGQIVGGILRQRARRGGPPDFAVDGKHDPVKIAEAKRTKIRGVDFPCEECKQLKGSTRDDKGFRRCKNCGYPSP